MRIAVASGKGGTGKTLVATHLAWALAMRGEVTAYVDADVEAPNGHLLLRPKLTSEETVSVPMPAMQRFRCSRCGECVDVCAFNAVVMGGGGALFFAELCHGCGNCVRVCPDDALVERDREIGVLRRGNAAGLRYLGGVLHVGEPRAAPLISRLWERAREQDCTTVVDCPPGTSCAAMAAVRPADLVLLVTEPTPFGWHDFQLALAMCRALGLPAAVVVNRSDLGAAALRQSLRQQDVPVIAELPFLASVGEATAEGRMAADVSLRLCAVLERLADFVIESALGHAPSCGPASGDTERRSVGVTPPAEDADAMGRTP
jgi:MinD superfamily P-loop ATPase